MRRGWFDAKEIDQIDYKCGHCGKEVGPRSGYLRGQQYPRGRPHVSGVIAICPRCDNPTFLDIETSNGTIGRQIPEAPFGESIEHIESNDVSVLYGEARLAISGSAFTAAVMCCRKILQNVAVDKGAPEGLRFIDYVNWIGEAGFIPPNAKGWVDEIRNLGNDANHVIELMTKSQAEDALMFTTFLLKHIYEFPGRLVARRNGAPSA